MRSVVLAQFYADLQNPDYKSRFAIYHRRFSTNTMPKWPLAQPFRSLGHNGEINTLLGNINWSRSRSRHGPDHRVPRGHRHLQRPSRAPPRTRPDPPAVIAPQAPRSDARGTLPPSLLGVSTL